MCFRKQSLMLACCVLFAATSVAQNRTTVTLEPMEHVGLQQAIEANASLLLTHFNMAYMDGGMPDVQAGQLTTDGREVLEALWISAPFRAPDTQLHLRLVERAFDGRWELGPVPLMTPHADEVGVLLFDDTGRLDGLHFGLDRAQYPAFWEGDSHIDEARRHLIRDFVENFRTAYNRRDIELLEDVFSEEALIIVGKVVERTASGSTRLAEPAMVHLMQLSKAHYLDNLRRVFAANEHINVSFSEIQLERHPKAELDGIYGVMLRQEWASSTYSDEGYLFLMIDFAQADAPIIHVRTWQPEQHTPREEVYDLGYFEVMR